jgi:hypothetical protein
MKTRGGGNVKRGPAGAAWPTRPVWAVPHGAPRTTRAHPEGSLVRASGLE